MLYWLHLKINPEFIGKGCFFWVCQLAILYFIFFSSLYNKIVFKFKEVECNCRSTHIMSKKTRIYIGIYRIFFRRVTSNWEQNWKFRCSTYYNSTTYKVQYKWHRIGKEVKIIFIYSTIEGCCFFPCQRFVPHRQIELGDF